ncbi:MAG: PHP domain-containing protein [Lachnospiraceae bacterium]|nr:PHP domain-containing protein [Lachnospiraceae bacterium]
MKGSDAVSFEAGKYVYETHLHTKLGSACGKNTGKEMAIAHKEAGYAGIIVTDHFFYGNTAVDRSLPWQDWVHAYCAGYRDAKKISKEIDLDVFFGWESGYHGPEFLIYGLDEEWLMKHPEIRDATVEEQYKLVHESGGVVFQAHPYREEDYIPEVKLYPEWVDGVEVFNGSNKLTDGRDLYNERAAEYALKYDFPTTCGSDIHCDEPIMSGMAFDRRLTDIHDFINMVMSRKCEMIKKNKFLPYVTE